MDVKRRDRLALRESENKSNMNESVDSHQAALDLTATQNWLKFDLFMTWTCNQSEHPGIKHLHSFKESMDWIQYVPDYEKLSYALWVHHSHCKKVEQSRLWKINVALQYFGH